MQTHPIRKTKNKASPTAADVVMAVSEKDPLDAADDAITSQIEYGLQANCRVGGLMPWRGVRLNDANMTAGSLAMVKDLFGPLWWKEFVVLQQQTAPAVDISCTLLGNRRPSYGVVIVHTASHFGLLCMARDKHPYLYDGKCLEKLQTVAGRAICLFNRSAHSAGPGLSGWLVDWLVWLFGWLLACLPA